MPDQKCRQSSARAKNLCFFDATLIPRLERTLKQKNGLTTCTPSPTNTCPNKVSNFEDFIIRNYCHRQFCVNFTCNLKVNRKSKNIKSIGREPWSSGYGKRLMFQKSFIWILAQYTGWTFFTNICCKNCNACLKRPKINEKRPFFKKNIKSKPLISLNTTTSVTRLGNLLDFGQIFQAFGNNHFPKSPTFLGKFCRGAKIFNFSSEIIFGELLQTFGNFYLVTLTTTIKNPYTPKPSPPLFHEPPPRPIQKLITKLGNELTNSKYLMLEVQTLRNTF